MDEKKQKIQELKAKAYDIMVLIEKQSQQVNYGKKILKEVSQEIYKIEEELNGDNNTKD